MQLLVLLPHLSELVVPAVIIAVIAYFCGCFNGSVIVSKYILKDDIRTHGSGNAGLTNFHRTFGGPLTVVVILTDVIKAVIAITVGILISKYMVMNDPMVIALGKYWAAFFCIFGHIFPFMFGFKGGKGILSGGTIAIMMDWRIALVVWGGFIILVLLTRYVSLGSIWASLSFIVMSGIVYRDIFIFILGLVIGGAVFLKHRGNLMRLIHGEERRFSFHKKK